MTHKTFVAPIDLVTASDRTQRLAVVNTYSRSGEQAEAALKQVNRHNFVEVAAENWRRRSVISTDHLVRGFNRFMELYRHDVSSNMITW